MCREGTSPVLRREGSCKAPDLSDYNNPLLKALHQQAANIWVERAAHIQESMGLTRGKTDQVDAKRIALFAYKNRDEARLWAPPRAVIAQLDRLTAQRARLVKVIK